MLMEIGLWTGRCRGRADANPFTNLLPEIKWGQTGLVCRDFSFGSSESYHIHYCESQFRAFTDACCKFTTPQMTCFRGAKCAQNGYRKKWRSKHTAWQQVGTGNNLQVEIGTKSGKLRNGHDCVVTLHDADANDNIHDCVVTLHDAYTNDNMTTSTDFHNDWAWARIVSSLPVAQCHIISHTHRLKVMSLSHHPDVHVHVSVSPRLALPFYLTHFLPHSFHFLPHLEVRRLQLAVHSAQRRYGLVWRVPPHHTCRCFPCVLPCQGALVKSPAEDCSGKEQGRLGLVKKRMYGTKDAASNWEREWQGHLGNWSYELVRRSRNLLHNKRKTSGFTEGESAGAQEAAGERAGVR